MKIGWALKKVVNNWPIQVGIYLCIKGGSFGSGTTKVVGIWSYPIITINAGPVQKKEFLGISGTSFVPTEQQGEIFLEKSTILLLTEQFPIFSRNLSMHLSGNCLIS